MRFRETLREAWRNTASGVSRPGILAMVFVALVGGLAVADARILVDANAQLTAWRITGASTTVVRAEGGIMGPACEALATTPGITAAGAARESPRRARLVTLPQGTPPLWEVTSGFARMVATTPGATQTSDALARGGVLLSESLAKSLGRGAGSTVATDVGPAHVAAVFVVPDDGRDQQLSYAMLAQTLADGTFDECRIEVWPPDRATSELVRSTLRPGAGEEATVGQLNTTLGASLDTMRLFEGRPSRYAPVAAVVVGLVLGFVAVRSRRLELASALHASVPRTALHGQAQLEAWFWLVAALALTAPVLYAAALLGNTYPVTSTLLPPLAVLAAGTLATLVGTLLGTATTREEHLFTYFKNR